MLFWETSSASCYLFRIGLDFLWVFFCLSLAGDRIAGEMLHAEERCHPALNAFFFYLTWSFFLLHPHMRTRTWHIISEKCLLFRMPWARLKKKEKKRKRSRSANCSMSLAGKAVGLVETLGWSRHRCVAPALAPRCEQHQAPPAPSWDLPLPSQMVWGGCISGFQLILLKRR